MLTSRQYGVATIWYHSFHPSRPLFRVFAFTPIHNPSIDTNTDARPPSPRLVATLGAKSNLKKVTRRAILDVNLPKACETITEPEVPIALRLQGSLLYVENPLDLIHISGN